MAVDENTQLLATVAYFLQSTGEEELARELASCEIGVKIRPQNGWLEVRLLGSAAFAGKYRDDEIWNYDEYVGDGPMREALQRGFELAMPHAPKVVISVGIGLLQVDENWRTKLMTELDGSVNNQNPWLKQADVVVWNGIRFNRNAPGEKAIAQALERAGVMYLPACLVRVGPPNNQQTFFPDFLICYEGRWGILEVDGQTYHKGTATEDYERMRKLAKGLDYFDRYPSNQCVSEPDKVVREFLESLASKRR